MGEYDFSGISPGNRPYRCSSCGGKLYQESAGIFKCVKCGVVEYDDFGKVKEYTECFGASPAAIISKATGVSMQAINMMFRDGMLIRTGEREPEKKKQKYPPHKIIESRMRYLDKK